MLKSTQLLQGDSYASRTEKRKLHLQKYIPPKWAENLKKIPEYKINVSLSSDLQPYTAQIDSVGSELMVT